MCIRDRPYLVFEKFTVHTDHHSLRWLFNISEPSGRLTRWRLLLAEFDFDIAYKTGPSNVHADALSRLLTGSPTVVNDDYDDIPTFSATVDGNDLTSIDSIKPEPDVEFAEPEYGTVDELLALQETTSNDDQRDPLGLPN